MHEGGEPEISSGRAFEASAAERDHRAAFNLFDHSGTGHITKSDSGTVLKAAGQFPSDEELNAFVKELDTDGDGEISYDEFLLLVNKRPQAGNSCLNLLRIHLFSHVFTFKRDETTIITALLNMEKH